MTSQSRPFSLTRREVLLSGSTIATIMLLPSDMVFAHASITKAGSTAIPEGASRLTLTVNGQAHDLVVDNRVTLLDVLREGLSLTGTKKGCDQGQCGACTVLVDGRRINSCLSLAVMHNDSAITTIEGLGSRDALHPLQAAFIKHDGYQCGYCTPGQICSAVGMLDEMRHGVPSAVQKDVADRPVLNGDELRERMSGNLCRCGAYSNIAEAIAEVAGDLA